MKKLATVALALFATAALVGPAVAGEEVTVEGKVICAKCTLKEEGLKECQNVLVVEQNEESAKYYLAKSEAADQFGMVCLAEKHVRATGSVSEKDGKMWLAATKIELLEDEG